MRVYGIIQNRVPRSKDWTRSDASPVGLGGVSSLDKQARRHEAGERKDKEMWMRHAERIRSKYPDGWQPKNKLSRGAMIGIKELHGFDNQEFSVNNLSKKFKRSPESIRRVLKSKWVPSEERANEQNERAREGAKGGGMRSTSRQSRQIKETEQKTQNDNFKANLGQIEEYLSKYNKRND